MPTAGAAARGGGGNELGRRTPGGGGGAEGGGATGGGARIAAGSGRRRGRSGRGRPAQGGVAVATQLFDVEARQGFGWVLDPLGRVGLERGDRFGFEPPINRLRHDRLLLRHLRQELAGLLVTRVELEGVTKAVPCLVDLTIAEMRFAEEPMGDGLLGRRAKHGHHLGAHLVVALESEQRHPEENPHLGHRWPGQKNSSASANRLLIAALGDQLLGAGGQILDRGAHRVRQG